MIKDIVESKRVKMLIGSKMKQCYGNAFRVVLALPEYADADYVEGMVVNEGGLVLEHGWVEWKDGMIVDPTLPSEPLTYFPGLRFAGRQGLAEAMRIPKPERTTEDLPIFYRFGWAGTGSPEFRAASAAAYRHAGMAALAEQYENYRPNGSSFALSA
jgi:hypothetical protein